MKVDWEDKCKNIVQAFFDSKKNSNCILELEELLLASDNDCILSAITSITKLFSQCFSSGLCSVENVQNDEYKLWLFKRYEDFRSHLLSYLLHDELAVQIAAKDGLMSFLVLEYKYKKDSKAFPMTFFKNIISCLLSDLLDQEELIESFHHQLCYDDIKLYVLKAVKSVLMESSQLTDIFLQNCFFLLSSVEVPSFSSDTTTVLVCQSDDDNQQFELKKKPFLKLYSDVWMLFLKHKLPSSLLEKVLTVFEDVVIHLNNPCLMTDFLTDAYNKGGVLSLLALMSLFHLMQNYNVEYPDFFKKLYMLLELNILNGKFSNKFFDLANLFLSSTYLSANIVCSFVKKLSHLSIMSNTSTILKILHLVSKLLSNHSSLEFLLHQPDSKEFSEDPFDTSAEDPESTNAKNSSLWEIKTLQSHINPDVSCKAKELLAQYPKFVDTLKFSKYNFNNLYKKQRRLRIAEVPLSISVLKTKKTKLDGC